MLKQDRGARFGVTTMMTISTATTPSRWGQSERGHRRGSQNRRQSVDTGKGTVSHSYQSEWMRRAAPATGIGGSGRHPWTTRGESWTDTGLGVFLRG